MKKTRTIIITTGFILTLLLLSNALIAQEFKENSSDGDWQVLFNGEDLSGWQLLNGRHGMEVKDGMIIGTSIPGEPNGFIATKEEYGDFILELEVKADLLMHNSGIQFRSLSNKNDRNGRVHGYQAEIDIRPQKWSGGIYDEARRGWLYILEDDDSPAKDAWVNNEWNTYRIEAIGTTNRVWVNGIPTSHLEDDVTTKGFIALQIHANSRAGDPPGSNRVFMRNVRIKTDNLNPSSFDDTFVVNMIPNDVSPQEEDQGFSLLWDGKTTRGWTGVNDEELPDEGWEIDHGLLSILSSGDEELRLPLYDAQSTGGGVMMTEKQYGPFELKFEFKQHAEGAIPGIEYFVTESEREAIFGRLAANQATTSAQIDRGMSEWNQGVIKVTPDNVAEYWLNGRPILEYQRDSEKPTSGHILLSDYGDSISFRSMKVRALK